MEGTQFGRYTLLGVIGEGGMGLVYRAHDTATDRIVALKVLAQHSAVDESFRQRFRRELRITASLREPHVVPIHDFGEIDGRLYLDMRLIEGLDVKTLLLDGPLPAERAVSILEQVAAALDAAHADGLIHRDIKPSNILVAARDFVSLIDFGIARVTTEAGITTTGATIGTFAYMAPERFAAGAPDARSDVYALACVLYEMLTGKTPFVGEDLQQQVAAHLTVPPPKPSAEHPSVPVGFDVVIARGMAKNPDDGYAGAGDLALAARAALTGPGRHWLPTEPADVRATVQAADSMARRITRRRVMFAGVVVVACAATLWLILGRSPSSAPAPGAAPALEASGFGVSNDQIWLGAIVRSGAAGQFITASFNLVDAEGQILATASQVQQALRVDEP